MNRVSSEWKLGLFLKKKNSINSKRIESHIIDFPWEIMLSLCSPFFSRSHYSITFFSTPFCFITYSQTERTVFQLVVYTNTHKFVSEAESKSKIMFVNGFAKTVSRGNGKTLMVLWISNSFGEYNFEQISRTKRNCTSNTRNWNWFRALFALHEFHLSLVSNFHVSNFHSDEHFYTHFLWLLETFQRSERTKWHLLRKTRLHMWTV